MNCTGLLFRVSYSQYWDRKTETLTFKQSARLLKRTSCCCPHCDFVRKELLPSEDFSVCYSFFEHHQSDGIYRLDIGLDSEGGIDDWKWIQV